MIEDWEEGYEERKCDHCGETRRCKRGPDPYLREIYPEDPNPDSWWCFCCWDQKCMDI